MKNRSFLCVGLLLLVGCAPRPVDRAWEKLIAEQPTSFGLPRDSAKRAWDRAEEWIRRNGGNGEVRVGEDLIERLPFETESPQKSWMVIRESRDDSVRIEVRVDSKPTKLYEILTVLGTNPEAKALAHYTATGLTFEQFEREYVPDSAIVSEIAREANERKSRVWLGLGHGHRGLAGELGTRSGWFGLGLGFVGAGPVPRTPSHRSELPTGLDRDSVRYEYYPSSFLTGLRLYGYFDLLDEVSVYLGAGAFVNEGTKLAYHPSTNTYYDTDEDPWLDGHLTAAAGLQISLARWLVLGVGYDVVTGWGGHLGYRF